MGDINAGDLTEQIMLQKKTYVRGAGGSDNGAWQDVQAAAAAITPLREKLELKNGKRENVQHFKVLVYGTAFGLPHNVSADDQFIWQTSFERVLKIDVITERPIGDNALEFEVYMKA